MGETRVWWLDSGTKSTDGCFFISESTLLNETHFNGGPRRKIQQRTPTERRKQVPGASLGLYQTTDCHPATAWLKIHWFCWTKKTAADVGVFSSQIGRQILLSVIVLVKHDMTKKSLGTHLTRNSLILFLKHHGNQWKKVIEFIDVLYATTLGSLKKSTCITSFYHGKSPLNHHFGKICFLFFKDLIQAYLPTFTIFYHYKQPNVGKYTIHGWYGISKS